MPVRLRAILLGLLLIPLHCAWAFQSEIFVGGSELIEMSLIAPVVFTFFLLVAGNAAVRRVAPHAGLTRAELLTIYIMQTVAVGVAGCGHFQYFSQVPTAAFHYATDENGWGDFHRFIPQWWVPSPEVIADYYRGNQSLFTARNLRGWAVPFVAWTSFILVLWFAFLCLATLLRKPWVERERLPFPLVQLPLLLTDEGETKGMLRAPLFWTAILLASAFRCISALPTLEPRFAAPGILNTASGQLTNLGELITTHPWNAFGYCVLMYHPLIIGITYFLPLDVSFSTWFFYLFVKMENVAATAIGLRGAGASPASAAIPYIPEQGAGAFLAIGALSLWSAKSHLRDAWRKATGNAPEISDADEALSYRTAIFGLIACFGFLVLFMTLGGVPLYASVAFFVLYLLTIVAVARLRAEAAPMMSFGPDMDAHRMLMQLPGTQSWSASSLTPLAYFRWFEIDYRTAALPYQADALKIAGSEPGLLARRLARVMFLSVALATVFSFITILALNYHYGAAYPTPDNKWRNENGQRPFSLIADALNNPTPPDFTRLTWIGVGATLTLLLIRARALFLWWPFHPAGFALAHTGDTLHWVWFPVLIGWLLKALILRYSGMGLYRRALPFFLGLVVGDILMIALWSLIGLVLGIRVYLFPG